MKTFLILLACIYLTDAAQKKKEVDNHEPSATSYDYEYAAHEPALVDAGHLVEAEPVLAVAHIREHPKPGYSVGGALVGIAKDAAEQAHIQLGNQHTAAGQAAYVAKKTLAQAASQSASTAATALAGKQIILLGLEQQSRDAHGVIDNEKLQLQQAEKAAAAAQNTAHQANHQVNVLTAALNAAQETADRASKAAAEAAAEYASQTSMVGQAKARAEAIAEQLAAVRLDYEVTQAAAHKAATAAAAAQNNAAAAGAHVADTASASALLIHKPDSVTPLPSLHHRPAQLHHHAIELQHHQPLEVHSRPVNLHDHAADIRHGHQVNVHHRPIGLIHHAEPLNLANALPFDGYDYKSLHY